LAGVALVVTAVLLGLRIADYAAGVAAEQQATRTATTAVLLKDSDADPTAPARWTTADGTVRTGAVDVVSQQHAGDSIQIWTDPSGAAVARPIDTLDIVLVVGVTLAAGLTVAFILLRGLVFLARLPIQRRCARAWEREWAQIEPRWRQRRHG